MLRRMVGAAPRRELLATPPAHMFGQLQLFRMLLSGGSLVVAEDRRPGAMAELIVRKEIDYLAGPPSFFAGLLAREAAGSGVLDGVRAATVGSDHAKPELLHRLSSVHGVLLENAYGMTECSNIARWTPEEGARHSPFRICEGTEPCIVDESCDPVAVGVTGEILVRGERLFQGYLDENGSPAAATDASSWFHTGDLGLVDDAGRLRLLGRRKQMFISHGFNVWPGEIERELMRSGMLRDAAVVSRPSRLAGEEGVAFVVPEHPLAFDLAELRRWLRPRLQPAQRPVRYVVLESLPLNANGKIDRRGLTMLASSPRQDAEGQP